MTTLGIHLALLIGPAEPIPAPPLLSEALQRVEITHSDNGRSGFQITFAAGRGSLLGRLDYPLLNLPALRPFSRVVLTITFNAKPHVLMDGLITHQQLTPSNNPGESVLAVTGEDISVAMDLQEKAVAHPAQDETTIVNKIILSYSQYGLIPQVTSPPVLDFPSPLERTPFQHGTDLAYLQQMATRFGYVFYILPGPTPLTNTAYWGPPQRQTTPQPALSVNMGPHTNVESLAFQNKGLSPTLVSGHIQDRLTNQTRSVKTLFSNRLPLLVSQPALVANQTHIRHRLPRNVVAGLSYMQALARTQGVTDASVDAVVTAEGELEALRYGTVLQARGVVGVRGAGYQYNGQYYVKKVTHLISKGEYKQRFTLTREGTGALTPTVQP